MSPEKTKRPYRLKERAASQERTRERIAEAAMELHGSVGPARTSISAVAQRAGVQRATVYRHFPDEAALFGACSAHWAMLYPPPDLGAWAAIADPDVRLRTALTELYGWYRAGGPMLANVLRDAPEIPAMAVYVEQIEGMLAAVEGMLLDRRDERVAAAIGHALDPRTHRSLADRGLEDAEIVRMLVAGISAVAAP